jgi:hypothetical protein
MIKRFLKFLLLLQALLAVITAIPSSAAYGDIVVKPGKFDHFTLTMPETLVAGDEVAIRLEAVDAFNNILSNFSETEREFQSTTTGSAVIKPASFKASSFANGALTITFLDRAAEPISISIRESGSPLPILSRDLAVLPAKLSSFAVRGVRSVQAGEPFDLQIIAKDSYGNTVSDAIAGKNVNMIFKGEADPKINQPAIPDFKGGISTVTLVSQKSGSTVVEVKDLISGSAGASEKIDIVNAPMSTFKIFAPKEVISGEPFELSIVAVDRFNNIVTNYAATGNGVAITSSGKLKPFPSSLPAYEFVKGQAKADMRYDIGGDITLTVTEMGKGQKGTSDMVQVIPPIPEKYEITTPESVVAGQKFKIKITVYNQLGHIIKNYNMVGPDVQLSTNGTGMLIPNRIPSSEFVNGSAVVEVQYNKSESFAIIASPVKASATAINQQVEGEHAKQPVAKTAAHKQPKKEKQDKAAKRHLEITNISIVESKKKSTITVHIPGLDNSLKYTLSTETADGKKWVMMKIKPPVSKVDKSIKFDSSFVGAITVDDDEKGTVTIRIEQLKPTRYHAVKDKNSLTITLRQ